MTLEATNQFILGIWGISVYCEAIKVDGFRSHMLRRVYAVGVFVAMGMQMFNLFNALSDASSLQIFSFVGCFLGCIGAMRLMVHKTIESPKSKALSIDVAT